MTSRKANGGMSTFGRFYAGGKLVYRLDLDTVCAKVGGEKGSEL